MTVNHRKSRFASLLSVALVVGLSSAANAGVIPWVYDAVFGPVRYPAYGCSYGYPEYGYGNSYSPYAVSYAPTYCGWPEGYSSCGSCGISNCGYWNSVSCTPCYGPRESVCATPSGCCPIECSSHPSTSSNSGTINKPTWSTTKKPGLESLPKPKETFAPQTHPRPATDDGLKSGGRSRGSRTEEKKPETNEVFKPAQGESESVIPRRNKAPDGKLDDLFDKPEDLFEKPLEKSTGGKDEVTILQRRINFDGKIAWRVKPLWTRSPFYAKASNARVARRMPRVESDWTSVPALSGGLKLVKK